MMHETFLLADFDQWSNKETPCELWTGTTVECHHLNSTYPIATPCSRICTAAPLWIL